MTSTAFAPHDLHAFRVREASMKTVYWPKKGLKCAEGFLAGWEVGDVCVVIGVLDDEGQLSKLHASLRKSEGDGVTSQSMPLKRLGRAHRYEESGSSDSGSSSGLQVWVDRCDRPVFSNRVVQFVLFTPPDATRLRFLTLSPLPQKHDKAEGGGKAVGTGKVRALSTQEKMLREMIKQDGWSEHLRGHTNDQVDLERIIPLLNDTHHYQQLLLRRNAPDRSWPTGLAGSLGRPLCSLLATAILATTSALWMSLSPLKSGGLSTVMKRSATLSQLALRLEQISGGPIAFSKTRRRPGVSMDVQSQYYMKFWNTVWLILNDLILGWSARQLFIDLSPILTHSVPQAFRTHLVDHVDHALRWLNDWPVGLKLNTPLSEFFCSSLGTVVRGWGDILGPLLIFFVPSILQALSLVSLLGLTFTISLINDLLSLSSLHLQLCWLVTTSICNWQLDSLSGLWNLFRGKRWNRLRQRTDSYAYDVDQLFLGTLLFTVSIFLFPTVLVYTTLFGTTRVLLLFVARVLDLGVKALNAFPLFELLLRLKEPSRLPEQAGIYVSQSFSMNPPVGTDIAHAPSHLLELHNSPKPLTHIFWPESKNLA